MIVATPAGQYDQTTAIKLLRDYDQPTMVNPEISALVNEKILVRHASASLTGRFFSFAQRSVGFVFTAWYLLICHSWLIAAQGPFASDFHDEASSMNEKLDCPGGYELPLISRNGGDIAALMSMVSDHQVDMGFDINTAPTVAAGQGILNTRKLSTLPLCSQLATRKLMFQVIYLSSLISLPNGLAPHRKQTTCLRSPNVLVHVRGPILSRTESTHGCRYCMRESDRPAQVV